MFRGNSLKTFLAKVSQSDIRENFANVSLVILFPSIFFYQTALGTGVIGPVLGSGWAFSVALLFPCLFALYLVKVVNQRDNIFFLEYIFLAFLCLTSVVTLIHFVFPFPAQHNSYLLYWNMAGVISNITCFIAFRLANIERRSFRLSMMLCAFFIFLIFLELLNGHFYFEYLRGPYVMSYQGFARCAFIVLLFVVFSITNRGTACLLFILFSFVLLGIQSRTEFILFVCVVPAIVFFKNENRIKLNMILTAIFLSFCGAIAYFLFYDFISDFLSYFSHVRVLNFLRFLGDESLLLRLLQTKDAIVSIWNNPIFGDYGSYLLRTNEAGNYSHNFLSVWVNLGLAGFILYCCLCFQVLKFCLFENITEYRKQSLIFTGALGLSAVVAHIFSYSYVEVLLACSIGAIAQYKEMSAESSKKSFEKFSKKEHRFARYKKQDC